MLGRILNTLSYRLNRDLREWRKNNSVLREYAWPWYQQALISTGRRPVRTPLVLCILALVISAGIWGYRIFVTQLPAAPALSPDSIEQHFFTLWTIQAAITALIYPIVIGFVTLLLQRRHSAKASLYIYLHDSAAILTGLSALFLVFTMGIQFIFLTGAGASIVANWLIIDAVCFLVNILGVIWFLVRTFEYLRPERRAIIVRTYAVNHVWPEDVRRHLEYNLFMRAVYYGYIPGPVYGDENKKSVAAILPGPVGRGMGGLAVTRKCKGEWRINDVRFRLLSLAIRSWKWRVAKQRQKPAQDAEYSLEVPQSHLMIIPFVPGDKFDTETGLCRIDGAVGLRWWERRLVRWSFTFVPANALPLSLRIGDLLYDLITDVQIAMQSGEETVFRESLHELVDMHAALIQAGAFSNDLGQPDNYAFLVDRGNVFEARVHDVWVREYRRLIEAAVSKLPVTDAYFDYMIHVAGWLVSRLNKIRPVRILSHLLHLPRFLHYRLNRWWSKTLEEQGSLSHGPCEPCELNAPAFSAYESAIKQFIGAWESLKNNRFLPTRDERLSWNELADYAELFTQHLDDTLYMLFDSVSLGNSEDAEWLCDSLLKWWEQFSVRFDRTHYYFRDERNLTLELVKKPWEEVRNAIDLTMAGVNEDNAPKSLWAACVHNYWTDLCCISLYALIQLGKDCECRKSLPARLITALGRGHALREGGSGVGVSWPLKSVEDLLVAIIRQYYFDGGYHQGYRARLDKVVEGVSSQGKPAMVPGRIYSGWGLEDLDALLDGQLVLLCLFVKQDWSPSTRFLETIHKWGAGDDSDLRAFVDKLKKWRQRLNDEDFLTYQSLFFCIRPESNEKEPLNDSIKQLAQGLDKLLAGIEGFRLDRLREAQISARRLSEVARWSSESGFSKETGKLPVSLFSDVQSSAQEYSERSLIIKDMNKGEFVEPEMAQRACNEDEWFDHTVSSHVAGSVMAEIAKTCNPETVQVTNPSIYWEQIKIIRGRIRNEGMTPVLFVTSKVEPHWLMEWTRSTYDERVSLPEDLRITRQKQIENDGYLCSFNDIPVYLAPIVSGSSYILPIEVLDTLSFTEYESGIFVRVSWEPVDGKDTLVNLKLSWQFHMDLRQGICVRLQFTP